MIPGPPGHGEKMVMNAASDWLKGSLENMVKGTVAILPTGEHDLKKGLKVCASLANRLIYSNG